MKKTALMGTFFGFLVVMMGCGGGGGGGGVDNGDSGTYTVYEDADGDGYSSGVTFEVQPSTTAIPEGFLLPDYLIALSGDCDDGDATVYPGAPELLDGADNDCDGTVDEGFVTYYQDADGDGYSTGATQQATSAPQGYVLAAQLTALSGDCDDGDATVYPGAPELLDGADNDCDGAVDEDFPLFSLTQHAAYTENPSKVTILFRAWQTGTGEPVTDLADSDFSVYEGSTPVTPSEHFREVLKRDQLPYSLDTVLLIDVSVSIRDSLDTMKAAARQFVAAHDPDTGAVATDPTTGVAISNLVAQQRVRIYVFDDGVREATNGWTSDADALLAAIDAIALGGPTTNLYGAIDSGLQQWNDEASASRITQGFLIGITDGVDTAAIKTLDQVKSTRGSKRVYMLGVGGEVDPTVLADIASTGAYIPLSDFSELRGALETVQQRMEAYANSFYYFYYASPKRSGTHTVTLSVVGNANAGADRELRYDFNAAGFSSVRPEITVLGDLDTTAEGTAALQAKTWWGLDPSSFAWASSDPAVATVAANPLDRSLATVTGVAPGQTTLTITDTSNTYYASTDPQVGQLVTAQFTFSVVGATLGGDGALSLGETSVLTAQTIAAPVTPAYTWQVADETIATLSANTGSSVTLTGAGYGATTITVTDTVNGSSASLAVQVSDFTLAVTAGALVNVGDTITLTATHAGDVNTPVYAWAVSDPAACSLDTTSGATVVVTLADDALACLVACDDTVNGVADTLSVFDPSTTTINGVEFAFVYVPAGSFTMGDEFGDGYSDELPTHTVTLTQGFYLGKYEVTQAQWQAVMGSNPSYFSSCGGDCPVETVSWDDIQTFLTTLNTQTGQTYRLPTEAEWEYAAKGGPHGGDGTKYAGSDTVGDVAWYGDNSGSTTHPVGTKAPNGLGLYDMSGNVWEWVQDWYGSYSADAVTDPTGPATGSYRVIRGGSWDSYALRARVSSRNYYWPGIRHYNFGFRLALSQ